MREKRVEEKGKEKEMHLLSRMMTAMKGRKPTHKLATCLASVLPGFILIT